MKVITDLRLERPDEFLREGGKRRERVGRKGKKR